MHPRAKKNGQRFYDKYCSPNIKNKKILDIGSYDANGTLKPIFEEGDYVGLDLTAGPNVDIVSSSHDINLPDGSVDIIISTSCFEHDDMFWVTFLEMCRLLKQGGYIYVNAPSQGGYHGWPGDNWRFYKDAGRALTKWAHRNNYKNVKLRESYIDTNIPFHDFVAIWEKE